jgi:hypothetical protein
MKNTLTQEKLKENLDHNPETGLFTWKVSNNNRIKIGNIAGSVSKTTGYRIIRFNKKNYLAHRLAFLYINGEFPLNSTLAFFLQVIASANSVKYPKCFNLPLIFILATHLSNGLYQQTPVNPDLLSALMLAFL